MIQSCLYQTGGGLCSEERTLDFDFCQKHLATPRGRQHMADVVERGKLTTGSDIERILKTADEIPELDYQTNALVQMSELVQRITDWERASFERLHRIPEQDWRYQDRGRAEQVRSEVLVYERALDRATNALARVSKMAIDKKLTALGKAQTELMIKMLLTVIGRLSLTAAVQDQAKRFLLEEFQKEAQLTPKLAVHTQKQLEPTIIDGSDVNGFDFRANA